MSANTGIEWTQSTWNPIRGCSRVSEGCRHCYAERTAGRFCGPGEPYEDLVRIHVTPACPPDRARREARWTGSVEFIEEHLLDPLHWKRPRMIFVNSMSDLFHENIPDEWIDKIFLVMMHTQRHTYQVLTKRAERMKAYCSSNETRDRILSVATKIAAEVPGVRLTIQNVDDGMNGIHFPNVWLGLSCEDQKTADERIPLLLQTPAAVRWVSYEPALGPVDFRRIHYDNTVEIDSLTGDHGVYRPLSGRSEARLGWVVCGGESGPGSRPFDIQWARDVRDQCQAANVPVFIKQLGAHVIQDGERRIKKDRKGGDWHEWPHDLRVREFPKVSV